MGFGLTVSIGFSSVQSAENAFQAVLPDLNASHEKRSFTQLDRHKNRLACTISAEDEKIVWATVHGFFSSIAFIQKVQKEL